MGIGRAFGRIWAWERAKESVLRKRSRVEGIAGNISAGAYGVMARRSYKAVRIKPGLNCQIPLLSFKIDLKRWCNTFVPNFEEKLHPRPGRGKELGGK